MMTLLPEKLSSWYLMSDYSMETDLIFTSKILTSFVTTPLWYGIFHTILITTYVLNEKMISTFLYNWMAQIHILTLEL